MIRDGTAECITKHGSMMPLAACTLDLHRVKGPIAVRERGDRVTLLGLRSSHFGFFLQPFLRGLLDENRNEVAHPTSVELRMLVCDDACDVLAFQARKPLRETVDHLVDGLCFVQLAHGDILQRRRSLGNSSLTSLRYFACGAGRISFVLDWGTCTLDDEKGLPCGHTDTRLLRVWTWYP